MDPISDGEESTALAQGRRIYVGNLLYSVKPGDIETLLETAGLGEYDKIHISIDPISGRNPGYCFVEFARREDAERALSELDGTSFYNRPVKVGPCHQKAKATTAPRRREDGPGGRRDRPPFERWGDWSGGGEGGEPRGTQEEAEIQGPYGALQHLDEMSPGRQDGRRLYVGGLGRMIDQVHNYTEVQELFTGFDV